jgi:hypothetical protein
MVRNYIPTGKPPGRPRKPIVVNVIERVQAPKEPTQTLINLPPLNLEGITDPEKLMKAALSQTMAALHTELPKALESIAARRPDVVIQFYRDMIEYLMPKLSRLETSGTVNVQHQHFVAVEEREKDPRVIPSTAEEVSTEAEFVELEKLPLFDDAPPMDTVPILPTTECEEPPPNE